MTLLPFFEWCEATWIGDSIRQSLWLFPVIEAVHLLGLCVLGGAILLIDLRLLGLALRNHSAAKLVRDVRPWLLGSIIVMLSTGTLLFLSEAIKCYYNTSFWVKITTLPIALLFTFFIRNRVASGEGLDTTATSKVVAVLSLVMWFTVAAAGRWIGFS